MSNEVNSAEVVSKTSKKDKTPKIAEDGTVVKSKDKKEKKQKRKLEEVEGENVQGAEAEKKTKKSKKEKQAAEVGNDVGGDVDMAAASTPAESEEKKTGPDAADLPAPGMSKKDKKRLEKARKAAAAGTTAPEGEQSSNSATASSSSKTIDISKASASDAETSSFLEKHNITVNPASTYPAFLSLNNLPIDAKLRPFVSKFTNPTPIQATSWPPLFMGKDVIGIAETGSGKTLAFGLPGMHSLSTTNSQSRPKVNGKGTGQIRLLVLAPTRELATQTFDTLLELGKLVNIGAVCLYGGVGKDDQIRELRKKETGVVVGTPGRILDLANSGDVDFSGVQYLVLDEADRMLDQGFENDIRRIIGFCPAKDAGRQTVMFSATWPESVRRLASTFLSDPVRITVGSDELSANKRIEQVVEVMEDGRQKETRLLFHLREFLKNHPKNATNPCRILVFALYKKEAMRLEETIRRAGITVAGLHGDLNQAARFKALDAFKTGQINVMVATDVAARGLDIPDVGLVINVTFPLVTDDWVHRIGRSGRAGKKGKAITFFTGFGHEKALAGEFMRVLRDAGAEIPEAMNQFPSTIKKKEHGAYGAFYKDTTDAPAAKKIIFD